MTLILNVGVHLLEVWFVIGYPVTVWLCFAKGLGYFLKCHHPQIYLDNLVTTCW